MTVFGRHESYSGLEEQAKAQLGSTIADIGSMLFNETLRNKESEEYSTAIGKFIDEASDYNKWQKENADKPDMFVSEIDNRREAMLTRILRDVRTPGAKARITNEFNRDFASIRVSAEESAYRQSRTNEQVSFENSFNQIIDIPADLDMTETETQNLVDRLIKLTDNHSQGKSPEEIQELEQLEKKGYEQIVSTHILQTATSIEDIDKANETAHKFGLESIFSDDEIDSMKAEYNQRLRREQADLASQRAENENELLFGIVNEEIIDSTKIKKALANGEIDASAYRRLIKDLGDSETNDAAYMEIEDAILDFGSGRKERSEVDELFNKNRGRISKEDKSQLMKKLSSERDKYLDNQTRTGHKIISNVLFGGISGELKDDITGEVNWAQLIAGGKATAEEIAAYRRGSILFNAWLDKQDKTPREEDVIFQALKIGNQVKQEVALGNISATLKEMQPDKTAGARMALNAASMLSYSMPPAMPRIVISNDEEYNKLPKGTVFYDKEGKKYRKP